MGKRIVLGIMFICIIGIAGWYLFVEMKQEKLKSIEIDGKWIGVVDGMDGQNLELTYRFKAEGNTLAGGIESRLGGGPISEGRIKGKSIEFKLNTGEFIILNKGTVSGDEIHVTQTVGKEKVEYVLKYKRGL